MGTPASSSPARRGLSVLAVIGLFMMLLSPAVLADDVSNDIDTTIDAEVENVTLTVGATLSVGFYVQPRNNDGKNGCNLTGSTTLVVEVDTSDSSVATVNPTSLTFTSCGDKPAITVTSVGAGTATIYLTETSNNTGASFNLVPATFSVSVNPPPTDTTPPVITPNVSGTLGNDGWYVSNVTVTWTVTDPESAIISTSGCDETTINSDTDTDGTTLTCTATSSGGTHSVSVTIKRDATAPETTIESGPDNLTNSTSASFSFSGNDSTPGSGVVAFQCRLDSESFASCTSPQSYSDLNDGSHTFAVRAIDAAGNTDSTPASWPWTVDTTPPGAPTIVSGPADPTNSTSATFVFTGDKDTVAFRCRLDDSGYETCTSGVTYSDLEDGGHVFRVRALDAAGNASEPAEYNWVVDTVDPEFECTAPDPTIWYRDNVTVECTATDKGSGLANSGDRYFSLSTSVESGNETDSAQTDSREVCDNAGNCVTVGPYMFMVDRKAPTGITFVGGPSNSGSYYFGSVPAAPTCTATDGGSGLQSCVVTGYSTAVGPHTLTATATDNVGNVSTSTLSYTVLAWTLQGFYQPVDMPNSSTVWNTVKNGSTVPLKFEVFAGATELTDTSVVKSFTVQKVSCSGSGSEDAIEFTTTGGTNLRYDSTAGQFVQNWQTPKTPNACYKVTMTTQDDSSLVAYFKLK